MNPADVGPAAALEHVARRAPATRSLVYDGVVTTAADLHVRTGALAAALASQDDEPAAGHPHRRAVVMTMGALHAGHLSLVRRARELGLALADALGQPHVGRADVRGHHHGDAHQHAPHPGRGGAAAAEIQLQGQHAAHTVQPSAMANGRSPSPLPAPSVRSTKR